MDAHAQPTAVTVGGALSGLVIVDKPQGWTSHDVVARMRRIAGTRKVGHAGTLDPMATGVLVVGVNKATRLLTYIVGARKTYEATIRLGQTTVTDDAEGDVTAEAPADLLAAVTDDAVRAGIGRLTGEIEQVPSSVSAIKVNGERAYARVRSGEAVELAARPVTIHRFELHGIRRSAEPAAVDIDVTVECSSGTYIRALARDLGVGLGVGGHLTALRRTAVGPYGIDRAKTLEELADTLAVLSLDDAARALFPARELDAADVRELSFGRRVTASGHSGTTAGFAPDGTLVALLEDRGGQAKARLVFAPGSGSADDPGAGD